METFYFEYSGVKYSLNILENTVKNEETKEIQRICDLRNLGIIWEAQKLIEEIEKKRFFNMISKQLIQGINEAVNSKTRK